MTTTNILARKKQLLERKKALLSSEERLVKNLERKERTRRLIELGGLVVKAELHTLASDQLLGGLLSLRTLLDSDKEAYLREWQSVGEAAFKKSMVHKTAVLVSFTEKPTAEFRTQLREHGLKWNRIRQEWQGLVILEPFKALVQTVQHHLQVVNNPSIREE